MTDKEKISILCSALQDISTTTHCVALAGPLHTPTLEDAWDRFLEINSKASKALAQIKKL